MLCVWVLGAGSAYGGWQLTWSDEFNGTNINTTNWTFETGNNGGWGNSELEYYTSRTNNAYVSGGLLHIVAQQESYDGYSYTSARMKTQGLFSQTYGMFEWRASLPQGLGFWPALWMLGTNIDSIGWPACGEIDVVENQGGLGSWANQVQGTIHYPNSNDQDVDQTDVYTLPTPGDSVTNFHVYAVQWSSNSIEWLVDSNVVQTWTSWTGYNAAYPAPFNQPFFIIMNIAVGGSYLGYPSTGEINSNTTFPGEMLVDYVRVYQYVLTAPSTPTGLTGAQGGGQASLTWDSSTSGATGYNVWRSTNSSGPFTLIGSSGANSYMDAAVSTCSTYYYEVSATNSAGQSTNSAPATVALGAYALAVDCGGPAAGQFLADTDFNAGNAATAAGTSVNTSGVTNPAPQEVYLTERYWNAFSYAFSNLTAGLTYQVRLHFAEIYWTTTNQRVFNVAINGTQVLSNFDIIKVTGSNYTATIQQFNVQPSNGQIVVSFTTVTDNAKCSGIEVLLPQPQAPAGLTGTAGNSVVALNWNAVSGASGYNVKRSLAKSGPFSQLAAGLSGTNYVDSAVTNNTTYYYAVSAIVSGCASTNSAPFSATPYCTPPLAPSAGNNGPVWIGTTLKLTASTVPGASYNWTGPNGFVSTNQNPSITGATTNAAGTYSVVAAAGGCASQPGTTVVSVVPVPNVALAPASNGLTLSWPSGTLQTATNTSGPWADVAGATNSYPVLPTNPLQFFRVRPPQ